MFKFPLEKCDSFSRVQTLATRSGPAVRSQPPSESVLEIEAEEVAQSEEEEDALMDDVEDVADDDEDDAMDDED
jgi:hypothetical protein